MSEKFYSLVTKVGQSKIANSISTGKKINFKTMKAGDGNGSYYNPDENQTDLVKTVWEGNIDNVYIDKDNPNWIHIEAIIPSNKGGFTLREYGAFDDAGDLIGVCKTAETYKPLITDGSIKELILDLMLCVLNTDTVNLTVDSSVIYAKKSDVDRLQTEVDNLNTAINEVNEYGLFKKATGDSTNILVANLNFEKGKNRTFIAIANNNGASTLLNSKQLYKAGTTTPPIIHEGRAYTVWADVEKNCFFLKASATGNSNAEHVLANKTFSNDDDTDLIGSMPNRAAINAAINCGGKYIIPAGYHNGDGYVQANSLASQTGGATATDDKVMNGYTYWKDGALRTGNATIQSLGGKKFASGRAAFTSNDSGDLYIDISQSCDFSPKIITFLIEGGNYTGVLDLYTGYRVIPGCYVTNTSSSSHHLYENKSITSLDLSNIQVCTHSRSDGKDYTPLTKNTEYYVRWFAIE
ncbi:hypothetical protein HMPREF1084_01925 [Clostridium butyricum 60E.3]|jgi:hypothetical protein|uniref:phage tail protein n=1 Tax=Clostridium butyricum TaxID=1492 RepID=UPI0002D15AEE|nr:phage tail protein [Clostridium butyricum]ALP91168.1 hypothetical protein ATN24_13810 [Clostridium butyricum]ANF14791.1 hypothetical protein AZ909_12265 [Clostridium butyricum]ENZ33456.1 hypothetical protein HMPREF1084_01925 [Clostridium butyricum 60E.3]MDP0841081.1 phage tail protein [Clostridium butyricum]NVO93007.1 phage tail protein [Clostridium butyricum]